jgi:RES domain
LPTPSPHPLASASLTLAQVPAASVWHHIFLDRYQDPLGFGFAPSRFSDPRKKSPRRFGVFYAGQSFEVAFLETIVRDRRNGNPGILVLSGDDLDAFVHVPVTVTEDLHVVDLRAGNAVAFGVPTNAVRANSHRLGQHVSLAAYLRPDQPDGIWYPSRLNGDDNIAVYDRAIAKLAPGPRRKLMQCPELAPVLDAYRVALV